MRVTPADHLGSEHRQRFQAERPGGNQLALLLEAQFRFIQTHTLKSGFAIEFCLKGSRRNADAVFSTLLKGASCQSPSPGSHSPAGLGQAGLAGLARGGDLGTWGVLRSCEAVTTAG